MHRGRFALLLLAAPAALAACANIIGISGVTELSDGGSSTSNEAGVLGDGQVGGDGQVLGEAGTDSAPCSTDLTRDKKNCGACGHDCLGGECSGSVCQPVVLAPNQGRPIALAVDDTYVYWTDWAKLTVNRVGKDGQGLGVVVSGVYGLQGVASDGEYVYWGIEGSTGDSGSGGSVWRQPRAASGGVGAERIAESDYVWDVLAYKGRVYFTSRDEGTIRSMAPDGGAMKIILGGITQPRRVAPANGVTYFTSNMNSADRIVDGEDASSPIGPGDYGGGIATDGVQVAWGSSHDDGTPAEVQIWKAGGVATPLATGTARANDARDTVTVAMDKDRVYFTFYGSDDGGADGVVAWCPKTGCSPSPVPLAKNVVRPTALVIDESAVYYATVDAVGSARIWKVAKP